MTSQWTEVASQSFQAQRRKLKTSYASADAVLRGHLNKEAETFTFQPGIRSFQPIGRQLDFTVPSPTVAPTEEGQKVR